MFCPTLGGRMPSSADETCCAAVVLGLEVAGQGHSPSSTERLMSEDAPADDVGAAALLTRGALGVQVQRKEKRSEG